MLQSSVHQSVLCNHSLCPSCKATDCHSRAPLCCLTWFGSASRKRIKKATATADGEPMEQNGSDLEDSDYEDEAEDGFIQADEEEPSGGPLIRRMIMLPCLSSFICAACSASLTACISRPYLGLDDMLISQKQHQDVCQELLDRAAGSQSAEDGDLDDALGEWDDAEEELYQSRLSQWESRQHLLSAADVVPGQVRDSQRLSLVSISPDRASRNPARTPRDVQSTLFECCLPGCMYVQHHLSRQHA